MGILKRFCILVLILTIFFGKCYTAYAPELFGRADMIRVAIGEISFGAIKGTETAFIFYGDATSGTLVSIGPPVGDRLCPECEGYTMKPISFSIYTKGDHFKGSIFFRGHARKFCSVNFAISGCFKQ